ncbi:MAG: penicillin-binding protein 2 [Pseudomonadota bacterium]
MFLQTGESKKIRRKFARRAILLGGLKAIGFGMLGTRLYQVQVMEGQLYSPLAERNRISEFALAPLRGQIIDRFGRIISRSKVIYRCFITPSLAGDVAQVLTALAEIVPLTHDQQRQIVMRSQKLQPNRPILIASDLNWEQVAQANIHAPLLPGIEIEMAGERQYYGGISMGHLVGYVGSVTKFALDDKPALRIPGAKIGKSGVELGMENTLAGHAGLVRREVDARGRVVRQMSRIEPIRGRDVVLSVASEFQARLMVHLSRFRQAAAVVLDTRSGDVIGMASTPGYNPGTLMSPLPLKKWRRLKQMHNAPMLNRAVRGGYPPGSTFKMVTALAALEAGVIRPGEQIDCNGFVQISGRKFHCWQRSGHGLCNLHRALSESCDAYFYEISRRAGIKRIAEMAYKLGLGQVYDNGLVGQNPGLIPDANWKRAERGADWYTGETLLAAIGQGYVQTTPLQLAVMTARLATGRVLNPHFAREMGTPRPTAGGSLDISSGHMQHIRRAMWAVVNENGGTGPLAQIKRPGFVMFGKTGTSQISSLSSRIPHEKLRWHLRDHSLFVGYITDASGPRFALSVIVEHAGSGGKTAAPLALEIAESALAIEDRLGSRRDIWVDGAGITTHHFN